MANSQLRSSGGRRQSLSAAIISVAFIGGCMLGVAGAGPISSEQRTVDAFTRVESGQGIHVEVLIGPTQQVEVRAQSNILPLITTTSDGGTLRIALSSAVASATEMTVAIVVPSLDAIALTGGSRATLNGLASSSLLAELSGGAVLNANGQVETVTLAVSGGARAELLGLAALNLVVDASGGAYVEAQASESVNGFASGGARVSVAGDAILNVEVSGGANVERSQ